MKKLTLQVQTHVEACFLLEDEVVSTPLGAYSGLPWLYKTQDTAMDVNFENANLGEEVLAPPLQNRNMVLKKGVHLHWIVPNYFGKNKNGKLNAVPNRWLVQNDHGERWIVISDLVHDVELLSNAEGQKLEFHLEDEYTIYPLTQSETATGTPPFCYLGKSFRVEEMPSEQDLERSSFQAVFGNPLTVLGFGHIHFSACYSNCKSVFGFHDPQGTLGATYHITGWHSSEADDLVWNAIKNQPYKEGFNLNNFLQDTFGISQNEENDPSINATTIEKTIYVASIVLDSPPQPAETRNLKIAVGNTANEAFSSLIADEMAPAEPIAKAEKEDQLEYFLLNAQMEGCVTDHSYKFLELRHQSGFTQHRGGAHYAFPDHYAGKTEDFEGITFSHELYEALAKLNDNKGLLNEAINDIASLRGQLYADWYKYMRTAYPPSGARDLFPDRDELQLLIESATLRELELKEQEKALLRTNDWRHLIALTENYRMFLEEKTQEIEREIAILKESTQEQFGNKDGLLDVAVRVLAKLQEEQETVSAYLSSEPVKNLISVLERNESLQSRVRVEFNNSELPQNPLIKDVPERTFWEPNEPVLAIEGFKFGMRSEAIIGRLGYSEWIDEHGLPASAVSAFAALRYSELHWCPFFLEWSVALEDAPLSITSMSAQEWQGAFFNHFYLDADSPGIFRRDGEHAKALGNDTFIQGGVILNPFMKTGFIDTMKDYETFCESQLRTADEAGRTFWNAQKDLANKAQISLFKKDILCQRLSGLNSACLMLRQVPQLDIREPLGFESSVSFSKNIAAKCKDSEQLSPSTLYNFLPVRNGRLTLRQLRLLDNFGRSADFDTEDFSRIITASTLTSTELRNSQKIAQLSTQELNALAHEVFLPPRLVQPARLNFHFIDADGMQIPDYPDAKPVCGWLVPNFMNENIMVFDAAGEAVGTLEKGIGWKDLPWESSTGDPLESMQMKLTDHCLAQVIQRLHKNEQKPQDGSFIDSFLSTLQDGLAAIAPADFALENAKILLMGRPIAVVRVHVALQIKGLPALDQSWQATLLDAQRARALCDASSEPLKMSERYSGNWQSIHLPLRLGAYSQLNDGLLGYWVEEHGSLSQQFFAPQTGSDSSPLITSISEAFSGTDPGSNDGNPFILKKNPDGTPSTYTALLDPRGVLHATTGILPTEVISLPTQQCQKALAKMLMWFQVGPILQYERPLEVSSDGETLARKLYLDLPDTPDYRWLWFEDKTIPDEQDLPHLQEIEKPEFDETHDHLPEIKNGFLVLKH